MTPRSLLPSAASDTGTYEVAFDLPEAEEASSGFTLLQLWLIVRAHLWLSAAIFLMLAVLAFVAIKSLPKTFVATAALIVHSDDTDPLAGRNISIGQLQMGTFFPTQVELINNVVTLQPVVDKLNLAEDENFNGGFVGDPKTLNDVVVSNLRTALDVQPGNGSQLLYVSVSARDPSRAADIANAISEEYLQQANERTNRPAAARAGRYNEQLAELKEKADQAQATVTEFRQKFGLAYLGQAGQDGGLEDATLADLQQKLLQAQSARSQLEGRDLNSRADGTLLQQTPEEEGLRGKLDELQGDMVKARASLGPRHPRILQMESEIAATTSELQAGHQRRLTIARDLEGRYRAELATAQRRVLDRRRLQDEGQKLVLEQTLAEEAYAQALRGLDEVKFASEGNYQDVSMVSRAEPPIRPAKPNKLKLFAAALVGCFGLAFGGPFAFELLINRRIRSRDDLERSFRIVTLAEFGRINPAAT